MNPNFRAAALRATITIETFPDDSPVSDAFNSGDMSSETLAYEARENAKLALRIDAGDEWAWTIVRVIATSPSGLIVGDAYLGGCSYTDGEAGFRAEGYFDDLAAEARADLAAKLARAYVLDFGDDR